jgi:hypothetical protein
MKKTRFGDYETRIKFPMYSNYTMFVVFTDNMVQSRMQRYGSAGAAGECDTNAMVSTCDEGCHIFFRTHARTGVIAHESFHAISKMLNWIGVKNADEEVIAYTLTYVVDAVAVFQQKVLGVKSKRTRSS